MSPPLASAQEHRIIAQDDCNSTCGTLPIPFPFGMNKPHCYAHKWFEIECKFDNNTSSGVPYLKSLNLEVKAFYEYLSMVEIMNPIYRSNCRHKEKTSSNRNKTVTIRGSPFVYSQVKNLFLAVGCNNLASLQSNGRMVGGCVSMSDSDNNNINFSRDGCTGNCCCAASLPSRLSEFNATLRGFTEQSSDDGCGYALIASAYWVTLDGSGSIDTYDIEELNALKNMEYAPAMLEWEILNYMLINSTFQLPSPPNCYDSNVTSIKKR